MEGQENNEETVAIEQEKKHRGRPAKTIQSGVTVVDTTQNVESNKNDDDDIIQKGNKIFNDNTGYVPPKKKRGRKPKEQLNINGPSDENIKKSIQASFKKVKKQRKRRVVKKKTMHRKSRNKKAKNILDVIKTFKMPKIKISLSGIKLPKDLTWHDVQIWSVAMAAIIAIALAK